MSFERKESPNSSCRLCEDPDDEEDRKPASKETFLCVKCAAIQEELTRLRRAAGIPQDSTEELVAQICAHQEKQLQELTKALANISTKAGETEGSNWTIYFKRQALISLPKFGGNPKEWPNFRKAFDDTTHAGEFSHLENLNRLQQALYGPALRNVQQLMLDCENVPRVIERLHEMYGRPELVYRELLGDLQRIRKDSRTVIMDMMNALENTVSNIMLMEREEYLRDHRLVDELVRKLPYSIQVKRMEYVLNSMDQIGVQNLFDLCEWLKPFARVTQAMTEYRRPQQNFANSNQRNYSTQHHVNQYNYANRHDANRQNKCKEAEMRGINRCTKKHHKSLHLEPKPEENINTKAQKYVERQRDLNEKERLRRLEEDTIRRAEDTIRRLEAIRQQHAVEEARRRDEEKRNRREEEARQEFDESNAKGGRSVKQRDNDFDNSEKSSELRQMFEPIDDSQVLNTDKEAEEHQSSKSSYDDQSNASNQLRQKRVRKKAVLMRRTSCAKKRVRKKAVAAARERQAISPTPKIKKKNRTNSRCKSNSYDKSESNQADSDNSDRFRKKWSTAAAKRSAAATDSDELLEVNHEAEPSVAAVVAEDEKNETIGCVSGRRQGNKEATGALTTMYEIKENGDLNLKGEVGDGRLEQMEKLDIGAFLMCLAKLFKPLQKQQQPSPGLQQPSRLHNTGEDQRGKDDHPGHITLRPSDGRWVPPSA
ncbi:uncharacterized protein LOC128270768 [Anopheles cruzii]|uniref:uncharacterized protein LOC128270768 n=1 Tax=Anopheles cruzii TaxID=68878 RepID=UPI0022EC8CC6|nr:uncharacterized protein LOC128270768 [Anopheles cruzii]